MEVRISNTNLFEIKTVAGFINFKICKISFLGISHSISISQFRKHLEMFKSKLIPKIFYSNTRHGYLDSTQFLVLYSKQRSVTDLFPSQTENPGYYMHEAGIEARNRRKCAKRSLIQVSEQDAIAYKSIVDGMLEVEFFGQRSWRPGCQCKSTNVTLCSTFAMNTRKSNSSIQIELYHFYVNDPIKA